MARFYMRAAPAALLHRDGDHIRDHGRVVRNVVHVAHDQLQRMLPRCQIKLDLGLSATKVFVMIIRRDAIGQLFGAIGAFTERRAVDQQVMMAGLFLFGHGPAGATPMPEKPKLILTGALTVSPSARLMR